jgi:hypothetical protein
LESSNLYWSSIWSFYTCSLELFISNSDLKFISNGTYANINLFPYEGMLL